MTANKKSPGPANGARGRTIRTSDPEQLSVGDIAESDERKNRRPEGMPEVWPLHSIPRRKRIAPMERCDVILEMIGMHVDKDGSVSVRGVGEDGDVDIEELDISVAKLTRMAAEAEDFLVEVAAPGQADVMREWAQGVDDMTLINGWTWYMEVYPPVEASRES